IHFLGYLPREELPILYSCADVFVFPSLYEGFGLPVLEALACGTPVVASSTSSLPEVGGDVVMYVDPQSPEDIAEKIHALLNEKNWEERKNRGVLRAREFSWKKAAMEIYEIYKSIIV
ncbi:MAG: glycosyltransferase, partial [bacterium]